MKILVTAIRLFCIGLLMSCCLVHEATGQLTAHNANGSTTTSYFNTHNTRDTIFAFNQMPQPKTGNLSLQYRPPSTIEWKWQKPNTTGFVSYKTFTNVNSCRIDTLRAGTYEIGITNGYAPKNILCKVDTVNNHNGTYTVTVTSEGSSTQTVNNEPKGKFTVTVDVVTSTFKWYSFDYSTTDFQKQPFATATNTTSTSQDALGQGGYKVTVTPTGSVAPRDSFVAWLYMNPGFNFKLYKDDRGEVMYAYKYCDHTDFLLDPAVPLVQSSFDYYDPATRRAMRLDNKITFMMRAGSGSETTMPFPYKQGSIQYFRDYYPPSQNTPYSFRGYDMFGIDKKDDINYTSIIPEAKMATPILPEVDPTSAPVPVKFINQSINAVEYMWRFGDGDSAVYDLEKLPPDTVKHTYYTPRTGGYKAVLFATSMWGCRDSTSAIISVAASALDVGNVFTPNGDNVNDYFKPYNVSIRQFEISIFTRAGNRIYHYKGGDLRNWQGWDGRIQNTGKEAAQGVYFYVIKAISWDDPQKTYDKNSQAPLGPFGGSFHLYR